MAGRIYIASSWKNKIDVNLLASTLNSNGFDCDDFTDSTNRFVFNWPEIRKELKDLNAITFLQDWRSKKACEEDYRKIDWCDVLVMLLPCGKSSHIELGYAIGKGKRTAIFAPNGFPAGEWEVMYGRVGLLTDDIIKLMNFINKGKKKQWTI